MPSAIGGAEETTMEARPGRIIDHDLIGLSGGLFQEAVWDERTDRHEAIASRAEGARNRALWTMAFTTLLTAMLCLIAMLFIAPSQRSISSARESRGAFVIVAVLKAASATLRPLRSQDAMREMKTTIAEVEPTELFSAPSPPASSARGSIKKSASSKGSARRRRGANLLEESPKGPAASSPEAQSAEAERMAPPEREIDSKTVASAIAIAVGGASTCIDPLDPRRSMRVNVTFLPSGRVSTATVNGGPYAGTEAGGCIARSLRSAVVGPFEGTPVTVSTSIQIP
jgi:hypothetical protein